MEAQTQEPQNCIPTFRWTQDSRIVRTCEPFFGPKQ
jgi:hypothetical protein